MSIARNIQGEEFEIADVISKINNVIVTLNKINTQPISVTTEIRKGQMWGDPIAWQGQIATQLEFDIHGNRVWQIKKVTQEKDGNLAINFKMIDREAKEAAKAQAYKKLLTDIDLSDENLRAKIREMLINVFPKFHLEKLLAEDELEFIMDKHFLFLRVGNKAYRV